MNIDKIRERAQFLRNELPKYGIVTIHVFMAIDDILAELDKAPQAVAWMVKTRIGVEWVTTLGVTETGARQIAFERYRNSSDVQHMNPIPLYTHPPQAAGLTVDEVMGCLPGATERGQLNETWFRENLTAAIQAKS